MASLFKMDDELFPTDPVSKTWARPSVGRQGNNLPIYAAFWNLELGWPTLDTATGTSFFETKFQAGGRHTLLAPHPQTGAMTLFTGVAIRQFTHTFTAVDEQDWNSDVRLTLGRLVVG